MTFLYLELFFKFNSVKSIFVKALEKLKQPVVSFYYNAIKTDIFHFRNRRKQTGIKMQSPYIAIGKRKYILRKGMEKIN